MSNKSNYRLLRHAIVTAIHPGNPARRGSVWAPQSHADKMEADALVTAGIATTTNEEPNAILHSTADVGRPPLSGIADAIRQADGTYRNKNGVRVNSDGTEYVQDDEPLREFLANNAEDVIAAIAAAGPEQMATLPRLAELEAGEGGKGRKTVLAAIEAAQQKEAE